MAELGFVGLGLMGGNIALRLLEAGHRVTGYNRTSSRAAWLVDAGLQLETTPRRVAEASDVVFSMVTDSDALESVAEGPDGIIAGLRPDAVYVDMSTVSPDVSRALAARVAQVGRSMLDAPVSGSLATIRSGQLSLMVGGDPHVLERIRPILLDIGPKVTYVGANGQGALMKLATNLQVAVQTEAFAESVLLAERGGIPRRTAIEVLLQSAIASPMLGYRGPLLLTPPSEVLFSVTMMLKDVRLALVAGHELGVRLPTTEVTGEVLESAQVLGYGDRECSAVFETIARQEGG
jgi:3-hydroxyisobutyrate dehydrogenase-like beta-hydroxyacid dehydrogenase